MCYKTSHIISNIKRRIGMFENEEYDVIELKEIMQILKKHWKSIIIFPIIFAAIVALVSIYLIDPVYEASTTIMVRQNKETNEQIDISDVNLSKSLIYTYAEMAKSFTVIDNTRGGKVYGKVYSNKQSKVADNGSI
jgi:capsular polysaccharide biosynthesis protein